MGKFYKYSTVHCKSASKLAKFPRNQRFHIVRCDIIVKLFHITGVPSVIVAEPFHLDVPEFLQPKIRGYHDVPRRVDRLREDRT